MAEKAKEVKLDAASLEGSLETSGPYRVVVPGHTVRIRVERDPDDPDVFDDRVVLETAGEGPPAYSRAVALTDRRFAEEIEDGITEVSFPAVPDGTYRVSLDMGKTAAGEDEGGYVVIERLAVPAAGDPGVEADPDPELDFDPPGADLDQLLEGLDLTDRKTLEEDLAEALGQR